MILLSIGLPGRFAAWCEELLARLLQPLGGAVVTTVLPSTDELLRIWPVPAALDEVALKLIGQTPSHMVVGLRHPDDALLSAIAATEARFIVALDDPRTACGDIVGETGAELGLAIRAVANCCPLMMRCAALPGALTLRPVRAAADIVETVTMVAEHLGLSLGRSRLSAIADGLSEGGLARDLRSGASGAAVSEAGWRVMDGALGCYAEQFNGGSDFGQIVWKRELFMLNREGLHRPTGLIDLAGGVRTLLTGPFIHLPAGKWNARVVLGVSPEAAGNNFVVLALADGRELAAAALSPEAGGVFAAGIDFSVERQSTKGLEMPLLVGNDNARGRVAFGQVVLQPLAMRKADEVAPVLDFATVLDL